MRKNLLVFVLIVLIGGFGLYSESLDDVLKKNYETRGGLEKLKAITTMVIEGKGMQGGVEFPIKMSMKRPNKMIMEAEFMGKKVIQAYNGKQAWWIMPMMGINEPTEMPEDQAKEVINRSEMMDPLVYYKEGGHKLELLGKEDMEGTPVYKLKFVPKDSQREYFFYLDEESGIELKYSVYVKSGETEVLVDTLLGDYKEVDGVMVPFTLQIKQGEIPGITFTFTSYKFNEKMDDAVFEIPAKKEQP